MAVTWKQLAYAGDAPSAHNLLDGAAHGDTLAGTVADGDTIIGNGTPRWSKLAITVPAAGLINVFGVANAETRPSWRALFDATAPSTQAAGDSAAAGSAVVAARRDHKHAMPSTWAPSAHALSAHDAASGAVAFAGNQATNLVVHQVADNTALLALTPVVGKIAMQVDTLACYICTAAA